MARKRIQPTRRTPSRRRPSRAAAPATSSERELVVVTTTSAGLRASSAGLDSVSGASVTGLGKVLSKHGARIVPLFGNEERVARALASAPGADGVPGRGVPDLTRYYQVEAPDASLEAIQADLLNDANVDGAYIKPPMSPPTIFEDMAPPSALEAPPVTADFTPRQIYLDAAPPGIDARFAWTRPGGRGQGVRIIDIEGAWRFSHEDLLQNQGGVIGGTQSADIGWRNHGTAVVGEFGADVNSFGVTGICPDANVRAISIFGGGQSSAKAITDAANALGPGDIILIELHAPGPRFNFTAPDGQRGFIAMEFWPADFAAIVFATSVRGVIVVEAAGNGAENFDDPIYNARPAGFPTTWRNPFNMANPQSGAIIVGAGAPPPGTHGRDHGPDRSRLDFSNFGARVDVQGWGREVTTCGYGDLQGGSNEDLWYTDTFSGTSSASPIVVGAIGALQGGLRGRSRPLLTPATAVNLLRTTGSPQQDAPGRPATQRIGNRPDLRQAFQTLGIGKTLLKDTIKDKEKIEKIEKAEIKERKDLIKDNKEKERKEFIKEGKELAKEITKEIKDKDLRDIDPKRFETVAPQPAGVEERLAQIERAVSDLAHFITGADRPDLQQSALGEEQDVAGQLERQAQEAKSLKDAKDAEKLREA
jgi:hypothetical protein